ncbi:kinase-like domain-containing protein [Coniella lustricola]|uniref:Kinase-like domain-containing protein n=1 Tax=Coniella lustricola TaxID=2025994 RepID=A0A2T3AAT5_9PEZI|nr:kinase-like domain-containing protein [Coniella lustricola]
MAAASPTPLGTGSHFTSMGRRTSARQALRSRPVSRLQVGRGESPSAASNARDAATSAFESADSYSQQYDAMHDSSDDEIPVPMKLSALTKALLNDGSTSDGAPVATHRQPSPAFQQPSSQPQPEPRMTRRRSYLAKGASAAAEESLVPEFDLSGRDQRRHTRASSAAASSNRPISPVRVKDSSPAPRKRIVRLSITPGSGPAASAGLRRSLSGSSRLRPESRGPEDEPMRQAMSLDAVEDAELNTPAQPMRRVQIPVDASVQRHRSADSSSGRASRLSGSVFRSDLEVPEEPRTELRPQSVLNQGSISRFGSSVRAREEANMQSSMRVKRLGKVAGSFLSGPARRGRRRESEEDKLARENGDAEMLEHQAHDEGQPEAEPVVPYRDLASSDSPISGRELRSGSRVPSHAELRAASRMNLHRDEYETAHEEIPKPRLDLPATKEQENIVHPPSAFNKRKASLSAHDREQEKKLLGSPSLIEIGSRAIPHAYSPERPILATISQNVQKTPHVVIPTQRPAPPPPPKMSVLETATATAGAATAAQTKKKSVILKVNGRSYQRVDCIGRGGSAKVYRVTAENGKMFALKRVNIENADANTVRGYKGEINLLQKLSDVERVIKLYDFELNEEKHMLSLLMEMGELDLNTLLRVRQNPEGAKLDPVFIRFYWKEMLECLASVHTHDIVHSDLKPANFVVVQGRLKLIDFGIANAIQIDETVNVHRETQIGTPNYMSPESLMDSNHYAFTSTHGGRSLHPGSRGPKLMKLGKPSDVWSLGCILYQMVYGNPPFGQIQNQMARCQAIINWNHKIDFPERGVGGVRVPPSLLRTMMRCLDREQQMRPTCAELLSEDDLFLYPKEYAVGIPRVNDSLPVTEELLSRIIQSVVSRCRERIPTDSEAASAWPAAYWTSVKKAIAAKDGTNSGAPPGR